MPQKRFVPRLLVGGGKAAPDVAIRQPLAVDQGEPSAGACNINSDDVLLTPAEAAERLAVSERVLERWRATGDGPRFAKLSRKTVRYRAADIREFVGGSIRANTVA